ncbi:MULTISPECIES: Na+/H+ antiporter subunit G [unclassified Candidatus Tisiphia]|uniref:Na+/H+ antiporter subunit G n=1 Tax=unclassified Candidatus Tisiphia TaxID=2996318 RepID=UPI001E6C12E1|nr:MAG: Na+/H+ antiporter subunit G [Rickettsia endosymbiont of Cimex lectularius]
MFFVIGYGLILLGIIAIFSGIVGLFRFPDFYTKIHAASIIECCGVPLSLVGLAFLQHDFTSSFKLVFASILILILNPVSTHAIGKAALLRKTNLKTSISD